ncbi:MAG: fused MFS/spermidine synthase [Thermodesulfobacteriota bacterium]
MRTEAKIPKPEMTMTPRKATYLVYFIFFASGVSGLIYEVVWLRMLSRIMGVTIYATSTVVAAFMAGLALGSFLFGKYIDRREDPLRIYALLEFLTGATALLVPILFSLALPIYKYVYQMSGENQLWITVVRTFLCFVTLLLPTTLMGGTLPVLTSWLVRHGILFGRSFSLLYGINTFGAVLGVIVSGFITLEYLGEYRTILLGVLGNFLVAILAYIIYKKDVQIAGGPVPAVAPEQKISPYTDKVRGVVLAAFIISGFTSLAYEVIWTRQLILFLRTSIYAFSSMLAVFLAGIALGSIFMRNKADKLARPLLIFGILELAIGFLSIGNLYLFPAFDFSLGTWPGRIGALAVTVAIVFPLTFIFGMIFPTAAVCYAKDTTAAGSSVGWLYSANTIGCIVGALLAGFCLIPGWGSTNAVVLLALLNVGLGLLLLWQETVVSLRTRIYYLAVIPVFLLLIIQVKGKDPFLSTIEVRVIKMMEKVCKNNKKECSYNIFFNKEGIEGTVTAFSIGNNKHLWINGIGMTLLCTETKLMTHLPIMLTNKSPKEMLIICFGMGTTLKSAVIYPEMNITSVELVPETYELFDYYHKNGREILKSRNVRALVNDGRNHILLTSKKYDIITVDPSPPITSAGTVNLYAREFFQLCKEHLTPEGVMCLWFPWGREDEVKSLVKTFYEVFPITQVFVGPNDYGFYLLGPMKKISEADFHRNGERAFANPDFRKDMSEYDESCTTSQKIYQMLLWDNDEIKKISKEGTLITDDTPYTEFFLWRYLLHPQPQYQPMPIAFKSNN